MKKISTKIQSFLLIAAMIFAFAANVNAQRIFDLSVGGETYQIIPGAFGSADWCSTDAYSGELILVDDGTAPIGDGCEAIVNDIAGKIAVIDRGECEFGVKCLNAENAGAIAVLVCNNIFDDPFSMGAGAVGAQVTIPCFMGSLIDCDELKLDIGNGAIVDIVTSGGALDPSLNILWGGLDNANSSFDGGINDWTIENISCGNGTVGFDLWRWADNGDISTQGAFVAGGGLLSSPSACNGGMYFDSDFYDNNGNGDNQGGGDCTAVQEGTLISPQIDISGFPVAGVSLVYYEAFRHNGNQYFVGWSTDGGNTWEEIEVNADAEPNGGHLHEIERIPLPGAAGASDLRIRFRMLGNYYYWMIDDVLIIEQEANNMRVNSNFFAIPQNAMNPVNQNDAISFLADIENIGASDQTDVSLNIAITQDGTGDEVFSADLDYGTVPAGFIAENGIVLDQYAPTDAVGSYTGVYTVSQDETDFDDANNTQTFNFEITEETFAKETGSTRDVFPAANNWDANEGHAWAYGNCYYIPNGDGMEAQSVSFGIGNADVVAGRPLIISLYAWADANGDGDCDQAERTLEGQEFYTILGTETDDDIITVPFGIDSDIPELEDNFYYIAMVEYLTGDDVDFGLRATEGRDYTAMAFLTDSLEQPRFAGMLAIDETLADEVFSSLGFGRDIVPLVRLNVAAPNGTNDPLAEENLVEVFPNPVTTDVNVNLDLESTQDVQIRIIDVAGKLVFDRTYENINQDKITIDAQSFSNGQYMLQVRSDLGMRTTKFVVSK